MPISRTVRTSARSIQRAGPVSAAVLACALLGGCAGQDAAPAVVFPSASVPPSFNLNPSPSTSAEGADAASVAAAISVKITDSDPVLGAYPNGWATFTLVVANSSGTDVPGVLPLVVFGPCTCDPAGGGVAPHYQLQVFDAMSGKWVSAAAVSADAKGVYAFARQTGVATLAAHQSLTYQYRAILSGKQIGIHDGTGDVDVYLVQQPGHTRLLGTDGPDASFVLTYQPN